MTHTRLLFVSLFCVLACSRLFIYPLRQLLSAHQGLPADQTAFAVAVVMLAQPLRPAFSLAIDAAARRGIDPRWWLRGAAALALVAGLGSTIPDLPVASVLRLVALTVACAAVAETVVLAAIAAEQARQTAPALLGSARTFVACAVMVSAGLVAGWIAEAPRQRLGLLVAGSMALVLLTTVAMRRPERPAEQLAPRWSVPATAYRAASLAFAFYAVPGFSTLFLYRQQELGFSPLAIGGLDSLNNTFGLLGAVVYHRLRIRFQLPNLLPAVIVLYAVSAGVYLFYDRGWAAPTIEAFNGLTSVAGLSAIAEIVIRGAGVEGRSLAIGIILCAANLGLGVSEILGTELSVTGGMSLSALILLHVGCYLALAAATLGLRRRFAWLRDERSTTDAV